MQVGVAGALRAACRRACLHPDPDASSASPSLAAAAAVPVILSLSGVSPLHSSSVADSQVVTSHSISR